MADIEPSRLALYSASALVIDQETGQPLLEKQSDTVVPIASISKLMTAMVVLDAKLDLNEVIAIGDDDVDGLKGTRSRLPVGTTMTTLHPASSGSIFAHKSCRNSRAAALVGSPQGSSVFIASLFMKGETN